MGKIMYDDIDFSGADIIELTQADYDALPNTKYTDNITYLIKDVYSANDTRVMGIGDCYSTTERVIGCWIDGKPLYQKTIRDTTALSGTSKTIDISSLNVDYVQVISCELVELIDGVPYYSPITWFNGNTNYYGYINQISSSDGISLGFSSQIATNRGNNGYVITIQYTKTTDVAGSGTWTPQGVPAVHYDDSEQVIGTFFGETLYQTTVHISSVSYDSNWHTVNHNISNVGTIVDISGVMRATSETISITSYRPSYTLGMVVEVTATNIQYMNNWLDDAQTMDITIRYTKTS